MRYWEVFENGRINRIPFRATDGVYWDVMKFRFVEGLPYSEKDVAENKPLVVISETSRKRFFGNETQVVGRQIEIEGLRLTVCGVVENVPYSSTYAFGEFWMPYTAWGGKFTATVRRTTKMQYKACISFKRLPANGRILPKFIGSTTLSLPD